MAPTAEASDSQKPQETPEQNKSQQEEHNKEELSVAVKKKFVGCWRKFILWFKTVFLLTKEYVAGDTCKFFWQKAPEVKNSFVYYRVAHMIGNLLIFSISFFHISTPYRDTFCATERTVLCIGRYVRVQHEWLFLATSWALLCNLIQSVWGLALTLRLYFRQKKARKATKDVENPVDAINRKTSKNVDGLEQRKSLSTRVRDSKSPLPAQSKDSGPEKPSDASAESKASSEGGPGPKTLLERLRSASQLENHQNIAGRTGTNEAMERGEAKSKTLPQDKRQSAVSAGSNIFIGWAPSKTLSQDKTQTTVPSAPKTVQTKAEPGKMPTDAENSNPNLESGAGPSATKEHKILSTTGFYWGLHSYSVCLSLLIDAVYWTLVWPYLPTWPQVRFIQVDEHGLNLPVMITDYCLVAFPVNLSHLWLTSTVSVFYVVVNCIYFFAGGLNDDHTKRALYPFMDWEKPAKALLFGCLITLATNTVFFILLFVDHYKFKLRPKSLASNIQIHS